MLALVDADTPVIAVAISAETADEPWIATSRLDRTIQGILDSVNCSDYKLFVSGKENFRKQIAASYKANRPQTDPKWREVCKQHLIDKWGAIEAHGCEADDYCGIYQSSNTIICGIDKDLLQIPGKHFRWEILRKGEVVRSAEFVEISELDGYKNFYKQMLTGDTSDNIIGIAGIGHRKASKLIDHLESEEEMKDVVLFHYASSLMVEYSNEGENNFNVNADLLWIMRDLGVPYSLRD